MSNIKKEYKKISETQVEETTTFIKNVDKTSVEGEIYSLERMNGKNSEKIKKLKDLLKLFK